jgi:hypothetical protein
MCAMCLWLAASGAHGDGLQISLSLSHTHTLTHTPSVQAHAVRAAMDSEVSALEQLVTQASQLDSDTGSHLAATLADMMRNLSSLQV